MNGSPVKKRLLINTALFAVVAALLLVIWISPEQQQQKRLPGLDADTVNQIRIEREGMDTVVIRKTGNNWQMTEPVNVPASPFRVNSILNIALTTSHANYALSDVDPAELGLAKPLVILYLNKLKISFGGIDPIDERRYTEFNGRVYLLDDYTLPLLTQPLTSFIDTRLLPEQLQVTAFKLPDFSIIRNADNDWQIEPPDTTLDSAALQEWVDRWLRQRAAKIMYRPQLDTNNGLPVTITLVDHEPLSLLIINNETFSGIYNARQELAYAIGEDALTLLSGKPTHKTAAANNLLE